MVAPVNDQRVSAMETERTLLETVNEFVLSSSFRDWKPDPCRRVFSSLMDEVPVKVYRTNPYYNYGKQEDVVEVGGKLITGPEATNLFLTVYQFVTNADEQLVRDCKLFMNRLVETPADINWDKIERLSGADLRREDLFPITANTIDHTGAYFGSQILTPFIVKAKCGDFTVWGDHGVHKRPGRLGGLLDRFRMVIKGNRGNLECYFELEREKNENEVRKVILGLEAKA